MTAQAGLKVGQTCRYRGCWVTLSYFVSPGQAIITYDDDTQERVLLSDIRLPDPSRLERVYNITRR